MCGSRVGGFEISRGGLKAKEQQGLPGTGRNGRLGVPPAGQRTATQARENIQLKAVLQVRTLKAAADSCTAGWRVVTASCASLAMRHVTGRWPSSHNHHGSCHAAPQSASAHRCKHCWGVVQHTIHTVGWALWRALLLCVRTSPHVALVQHVVMHQAGGVQHLTDLSQPPVPLSDVAAVGWVVECRVRWRGGWRTRPALHGAKSAAAAAGGRAQHSRPTSSRAPPRT